MTAKSSPDRNVRCGRCNGEVDEEPGAALEQRAPCPNCGSTARAVGVFLSDTIEMRSSLSIKAKAGGKGKPFMTQKIGSSLFHRTGRWHFIEQLVDRRNNRYKKKIVDEETGEVLRDDDGLLTDHQGFGSAKERRPSNNQ